MAEFGELTIPAALASANYSNGNSDTKIQLQKRTGNKKCVTVYY